MVVVRAEAIIHAFVAEVDPIHTRVEAADVVVGTIIIDRGLGPTLGGL